MSFTVDEYMKVRLITVQGLIDADFTYEELYAIANYKRGNQ